MAPNVMILMQAWKFRALKIEIFLGTVTATSEASACYLGPKTSSFSRPTLTKALEMDGVHCTEKTYQIRFKVLYQERITLKFLI